MQPTAFEEIALPAGERDVALADLFTKDGAPVVVRCFRLSALELFALARPQIPTEPDFETLHRVLPLIEAGTALAGENGELVRPAFWFKHEKAGAVPGGALSMRDIATLFQTISELSRP